MLRRSKASLIVLFGYAAISFTYFGWRLLPHPGRVVIGAEHDPQIFVWSFAWWPYAIGHWTNPFVTHALYAPSGINLAWTASAPGLALAFSPVTLLFGPVASFNVAALLLPALSAWTAYLLCRHVTGSIWASLIGGYLFGFSACTLNQQLLGHLHVTGVFVLPLVALVVVRYLEADLSTRGFVWRLGILLALQFWISTEFAFTLTLVLALGLLLAFWLVRAMRPRLRSSVAPIAASYVLGGALSAPLLIYAVLGFASGSFVTVRDSVDLLNFVIPTQMIGLGGSSATSVTNNFVPGGAGAYLGLPTLLIVAAFAIRARHRPSGRFLVAAFAVSFVIVLGTSLRVDGRSLIGLPWWRAAAHVPGLDNLYPFRFSVYVALAAAVIVARWMATTRGLIFSRPCVPPLLAVAALVPGVWRSSYPSFRPSHPASAAFFTDSSYKACIRPGQTVAIFPFGVSGDSMLLQAETDFWFRLAANGLQPTPKYGTQLTSFDKDRIVWDLTFNDAGRPTMDRLLAFAATHHVDRVLSFPSGGYPSRGQMKRFGPTELIGGMLVAPACGRPSLAHRDLSAYVRADKYTAIGSAPSIGYCIGLNFNLLAQGLYPAGLLKGARRAIIVPRTGLTCAVPAGYKRHGFAPPDMGVPANTYPLYTK